MPNPGLAVLGNLILDDVVLPDGTTRMRQPGGAALYAALGASLWGVEAGIVSVVGEDYPADILDTLAERGIRLEGVRRIRGPTLRTWLLYEGRRRRVVHRLDGPTHAQVSPGPDDLPGGWHPAACHLAPMPLDVQQRLAATLTRRSGLLLSLDPYELAREEDLSAWHELLSTVDLLFLSEDEMELVGGLEEPEPALRRLAAGGGRLRRMLYKRGERGGLAFDVATNRLRAWEPLPTRALDPTGAGDAFAGGLLAGEILGDDPITALRRGLVSAGFALEGRGPDSLLRASPQAAAARLAAAAHSPSSVSRNRSS